MSRTQNQNLWRNISFKSYTENQSQIPQLCTYDHKINCHRHKTNTKTKTYITLPLTNLKDIENTLLTQVSLPQIPAPAFIHLAMSYHIMKCFNCISFLKLTGNCSSFLTTNMAKEKLEVPFQFD